MNKPLLFPLIALLALCSFFTKAQNNSITYSAQYANAPGKNTNAKTTALQAVSSTTTATCMAVNLPVPTTWTLVNYGLGSGAFAASGFANGPNANSDREKAMYFDVSSSANTHLTQVYVAFDRAYTATPTKTVAIKIYDGTTGTPPANALATRTIAMSTIMTDVANNQYSLIMFPNAVTLPASKRFFVSVDVSGLQWTASIKDSLSIVSNQHPQTNPSPVWDKKSTNLWYNYGASSSTYSLHISLLVHPFLSQGPITASITSSQNTICAGQNIAYSSTGSTQGAYQWNFGAIGTPTASGPSASPTYSAPGTFTTTLIVQDGCGSFGVSSKTILVNPNPTITAIPASTSVCQGESVTLTASGASTYSWSGGVNDNVPFTPAGSTNYVVVGTAANNCTASAIAAVVVNPIPAVTANASSTNVCSGSTVSLSGGGASTYSWTGGITNGASFSPTAPDTYTVTGYSAANCSNTAVISLTIVPNPTVSANITSTTICSGTGISLSGSGANTYSWTGGVNNGVTFNPSSSLNYTVTGYDANGCSGTATVDVLVDPCTGVNENSHSVQLFLYPNPSQGDINIIVKGSTLNLHAEIYNTLGQLIVSQKLISENTKIKTELNSGIYLIRLMDGEKVLSTQRLIKN
jgi:hypothetical protein